MNAQQFLDSLTSHSILSAAELSTVRDALDATKLNADAEPIAKELVRLGKLTKYQASNVYRGRGKGLVFGEYVILDKIGAGGMGQVFKAQHRRMKRTVALKILPTEATKSPGVVKRFYQEVELAARLSHPNIVTAFDASEAHGLHYLVMEFVDGSDLSSVLSKHGPLSIEQAMNCVMQAARGLQYAHDQGIIHRDIKPGNILIDRKGGVKILDLGLARLQNGLGHVDDGAGLTMSGQVMGTVDYMSPEQAHDTRSADHRSDIYSLGCTLYRLITNKVPYQADTILQKILAHREQPVPSLRTLRPEASERLDQLCQRMLAKRPEDRPASMNDVAKAIEGLLAGKNDEASSVIMLSEALEGDELQSFLKSGIGSGSASNVKPPPSNSSPSVVPTASASPPPHAPTGRALATAKAIEPSNAAVVAPATRSRLPIYASAGAAAVLLLAIGAYALWPRGDAQQQAAKVDDPNDRPFVIPQLAPNEPAANPADKPTPPPPTNNEGKPPSKQGPPKPPPPQGLPSSTTPPAPTMVASTAPAVTPEPPKENAQATSAPPTPTTTDAKRKPAPLTEPVDLLKLMAAKPVEGNWAMDGSVLVHRKSTDGHYKIAVPYAPPDEYDLTAEIEGPLAQTLVRVGLNVQGRGTAVNYTRRSPQAAISIDSTEPTFQFARSVPVAAADAGRVVLACAVRKGRFFVAANGVPAIDWQGNPDTLQLPGHIAVGEPGDLVLGCQGSTSDIRFAKLEIAPPKVELPAYGRFDLLALFDPKRDVTTGVARRDKGDLLIEPNDGRTTSLVGIETNHPAEYTLTAVVERIGSFQELFLGMPFGSSRAAVSADHGGATDIYGANKPYAKAWALTPWRLHTLVCSVSATEATLSLDGREIVRWERPPYEYGPFSQFEGTSPRSFALWCTQVSGFRIHALEVTPRGWQRLPAPPTEAAAQAAEQIVGEMATNKNRQQVAQLLWQRSAEAHAEPARRYALLEQAALSAAQAGDLNLACHAVTDLVRSFNIDSRTVFANVIGETFKAAKSANEKKALLEESLRQIDRAAALEEWDLAVEIQTAAANMAKPVTSDIAKELKARGIELRLYQQLAAANRAAQEKLSADKKDVEANRAVGRYLALARHDWSAAAKALQAGEDATLAAIADGETAKSHSADELAAQGDRWWGLFEKGEVPVKYLAMERAASWYRRALIASTGKPKATIGQRRQAAAQQRKASALAFVPRHPLDAVPIGGHWYKVYRSGVTWKQAAQFCEEIGGNLVIIDNADENQRVAQLIVASAKGKEERGITWLGLTDEAKEGEWRWVDGTPLLPTSFTNWSANQPDNGGGDSDAAFLEAVVQSGQATIRWDDINGANHFAFVCEWEQ
ncbi:MAG: protein kinase [Planctomycetes bacterium]|nr:protein kinase [Planctomycetota bacterium]